MFLRIDRLQIALPQPKEADPNAPAAVQELLGGRFGEMSTLMNYMFQSFNFRARDKLKPFYDLVANIGTEEMGHVELVAATVNLLLVSSTRPAPPEEAPLARAKDVRNTHHFIFAAQGALPMNSMGAHWSGDYVFSTGNLILDLVYNFLLESNSRLQKIRVYEMTKNPVAREMIGYLLVRGTVHATAYARALEILTGVNVTKLLPLPNIENAKFPEARKWEAAGVHRKLYRFSLQDYKDIAKIWRGPAPTADGPLQVVEGPPEGGPVPVLPELPEEFAPGLTAEDIARIARKMGWV